MLASNTKSMTTLLLATLVDEGKLTWDTPVIAVMPDFKLGDPETTKQVLIKHLVCACTGLPRQDFEWLFEFTDVVPLIGLHVWIPIFIFMFYGWRKSTAIHKQFAKVDVHQQ